MNNFRIFEGKKSIVVLFVLGTKISVGNLLGTGQVRDYCGYLKGVPFAMGG